MNFRIGEQKGGWEGGGVVHFWFLYKYKVLKKTEFFP